MLKKLYETPAFEVHKIDFEVICRLSNENDVIVDADDENNWVTNK